MLKITRLTRFGNDEEYLDITFTNDVGDDIEICMNYKDKTTRLTCEEVNVADVQEVLAIIESKKIEIKL